MLSLVRTLAILCAAKASVYFGLPGLQVYDRGRDARTFRGGMPVIAHPPCRGWSAFCSHQAKPEPGEMELGLLCARHVLAEGGILEQPAWSGLFAAAGLPLPGERGRAGLWSALVWQEWWGAPVRKATWLCFSQIPFPRVQAPLVLRCAARGDDHRFWRTKMHEADKSASSPAFAAWLVSTVRAGCVRRLTLLDC